MIQTMLHRLPTGARAGLSERVPFSGEGLSTVSSPVTGKKKEKWRRPRRVQEQSSHCSSHVTLILHNPALRYPMYIASPVEKIEAPRSKEIVDGDEDEWEFLAEYEIIE